MASRPSPQTGPSREVVLHIGGRKTGTSSIQFFLRDNRERLMDLGCLYPRTPGRARHVRLGLSVKSDEELEHTLEWHREKQRDPARFRRTFRRKLLAEIERRNPSQVVFSDEALYGFSRPALQRLHRLTSMISDRVRVVVYLRRQDDHLISSYQQEVKTGEVRRLAEWAQQDMSAIYDYRRALRRWDRLVEPAEIVVRRFEPSYFAGGSLFQDFLDAAGVDIRAEDLEPVPNRNDSLDVESVEFLRLLNLYRVEHEGATVRLIDNRSLLARLTEASGGPVLTLPGGVLDDFMTHWEEPNRRVALDLLGDHTGTLFRTPRKTRGTTTEQRLDPGRLDHFLALTELPEHIHAPLRTLAEREARVG